MQKPFSLPVASLVVLIFFLGVSWSRGAAPAAPTLGTPDGETLPEGANVDLAWTDPDGNAMWFEVYVQKDGALYFNQWFRGDQVSAPTLLHSMGALPAGSYKFWVRGWEPCFGAGQWSMPGSFTVECVDLMPSSGFDPPDSATFDGRFPTRYATNALNSGSTWSEIQIFREGVYYGGQWVQNDVPGAGLTLPISDVTGFDPALPDGNYTWKSRDYSPCGGTGDWSPETSFTVSNTNCVDVPGSGSVVGFNLFHSPTNAVDMTNAPEVYFGSFDPGTSWTQAYVVSKTTGTVVFNEWRQFDQLFTRTLPFLGPGDYEIYMRSYNRCGTGLWSDVPTEFTIASKPAATVQSLEFRGFDGKGLAFASWDAQPGIDWYQVYATCGGVVVMNQWFDVSNPPATPDGVHPETGTGKAYVRVGTPCAGSMVFWVRTYTNGGEFGEWTGPIEGTQVYSSTAPVLEPVTTQGSVTTVNWNDSTPVGEYEIYITEAGSLYYNAVIPCRYLGPNASGPGHPEMTAVDSEWNSYFQLCPGGSYSIWVRSVLAGAASPWSDPVIFFTPIP